MNRDTENALLLLVGLSVGIIAATGAYTRYVKPTHLPWLVAAAVFIIVLAASAIIRDLRRDKPDRQPIGHTHRSAVAWLVGLPIVVLAFIAPPAITPRAVNTPTVTDVSTDVLRYAFPPLPTERAPRLSLPELLGRANLDSAGTLDGRTITVTGFTLKEPDYVDLAVMHIICCAADARALRIRLGGPAAAQASAQPDQTWLSVEGIVRNGPPRGGTGRPLPVLEASSITPIPAPANPYAY